MPESRHRYLYERLGDHDFQQLANALLAAQFPNFTPMALRQADGGIDGQRKLDPSTVLIYQVKWSVSGSEKNPVSWLDATDSLDASQVDVAQSLKELVPEGLDYVFDAIGKTQTTEQAIAALGLGGAAVIVGLPPAGSSARFDPLALATNDQRILGSNYGSINPHVDIPKLVDWFMDGQIDVESMISARMPLLDVKSALDDLAHGHALRQLLIPADRQPLGSTRSI